MRREGKERGKIRKKVKSVDSEVEGRQADEQGNHAVTDYQHAIVI